MVALSTIGCTLFIWIGMMDQRGCEELRQQEANLDTIMWLKLLFVPTLGIVILTLFLLEEYCYCYAHEHESHAHSPHAHHALQHHHSHHAHQHQQTIQNGTAVTSKEDRSNALVATVMNGAAGGKESTELTRRPASGSSASLATLAPAHGTLTGAHYEHPLTLLSLAHTPGPSTEYPVLSAAPLAPQSALHNPQELLAAQGRAVRQASIMPATMSAHHAQVTLMGHPASFASSPASQSHAFRINLLNEAGVSCILVVHSGTTLREVFAHYAARNNAACWIGGPNAPAAGTAPAMQHSLYKFSYQGQPLTNEKATLATIGIGACTSDTALECEIIHVELDFEVLYAQLRQETHREESSLADRLTTEDEAMQRDEEKWATMQQSVEEAREEDSKAENDLKGAGDSKVATAAALDATKQAIQLEQTALAQARREKLAAEGSDAERIEHKRLDKMRGALSRDLDSLTSDVAELSAKQSRLEKERLTLVRESAIVRDKTSALEEEATRLAFYATSEESANGVAACELPAGFVPLPALSAHLESLERQFAELQAQRKKVDYITGEIAHKRSEVHTLAKKVHMSAGLTANSEDGPVVPGVVAAGASAAAAAAATATATATATTTGQTKLDALPSLRLRVSSLEKDTKDLLRWKSIAKHLEMESKECFRWKSLLRAALAREKHLEHATSEMAAWRARAKAFEKEAKEMREWKKVVMGEPTVAVNNAGDFYASPAAAAAAGAGLGLGLAYDIEPLPIDTDDYDEADRIDPQPHHVQTVSEEEVSSAAAAAQTLSDGVDRDRERMSEDLLAAEMEEERLVHGMRRDSIGSGSGSGPSSRGDTDEEDLFKLGEALVRRNHHLHQHRLMLRYQHQQQQQHQQHQQMVIMQQHQRDASMDLLQPQHQQMDAQMAHNSLYTGKTGLTGMLQASAPVFTPRYHSDTSTPLASGVSAGGLIASHYTKVSPSGGAASIPPSHTPSPPIPSLTWSSTATNVGGSATDHAMRSVSMDMDPHMLWNPSLQALLDDLDASTGVHSASAGTSSTSHIRGRDRSFSNPSMPPAHPSSLNQPLPVSQSLLRPLGVSSGLSVPDPFTAFRRSQNLTIIDDGNAPAPDHDRERDAFTMHHGHGLSLDANSTGFHAFTGSQLPSRVHSGASSPFGTHVAATGLPPFFALGGVQTQRDQSGSGVQ